MPGTSPGKGLSEPKFGAKTLGTNYPPIFPGQPCALRERGDPAHRAGWVRAALLLRSIRKFRFRAIAAHPGISPVGNLALVLGKVGAPGICLDCFFGLPDDIELSIRPDLADHHRLGEVMIGIHYLHEPARGFDLLAIHRLPHRIDIRRASLSDRLRPHLDADVVSLHRIVCDAVRGLYEV